MSVPSWLPKTGDSLPSPVKFNPLPKFSAWSWKDKPDVPLPPHSSSHASRLLVPKSEFLGPDLPSGHLRRFIFAHRGS